MPLADWSAPGCESVTSPVTDAMPESASEAMKWTPTGPFHQGRPIASEPAGAVRMLPAMIGGVRSRRTDAASAPSTFPALSTAR